MRMSADLSISVKQQRKSCGKTIADSRSRHCQQGEDEEQPVEQKWVNAETGKKPILMEELGAWNLYHGLNLEDSFGDYAEALAYLKEEQFQAQAPGDAR